MDVNAFGIYDILAIIAIVAFMVLIDGLIRLFAKHLLPSKPPYFLFNCLYIPFVISLFVFYFMGRTHPHAIFAWILAPLLARLINQLYLAHESSVSETNHKSDTNPEPSKAEAKSGPTTEEQVDEFLKKNKR